VGLISGRMEDGYTIRLLRHLVIDGVPVIGEEMSGLMAIGWNIARQALTMFGFPVVGEAISGSKVTGGHHIIIIDGHTIIIIGGKTSRSLT